MNLTERTLKCPICGNPYVVYAYYVGDQSACDECKSKARAGEKREINRYRPDENQEILRDFFEKIERK